MDERGAFEVPARRGLVYDILVEDEAELWQDVTLERIVPGTVGLVIELTVPR